MCRTLWWSENQSKFPAKGKWFTIQFGSLEPIVMHDHRLTNPITQEEFFLVSFFDKVIVNMTSCSTVEEETGEEDGR